jgi:hypothetical protein
MYVVIVDTRGMSPSQIDGYEEYTCTQELFDEHVLDNPKVRCSKSKVAELCGLDMKICFHKHLESRIRCLEETPEVAITHEQEDMYPRINGAATLLTFDPRTGFPDYKIMGKAYVVVDSGDYPLSNHQVWGLQELISEARDLYHCDPDHLHRGRRDLLRWCHEYQEEKWGPLTIYKPRVMESNPIDHSAKPVFYVKDGYYHHRRTAMSKSCNCTHCQRDLKFTPCHVQHNDENVMHQPSMLCEHRAKATRLPRVFFA